MTIQQILDIGREHHRAGRFLDAEKLYRQILAQQPNHPQALHYLGLIAHQAGRYDIAADLIGRSITLSPDWPDAYCNLANALKEQGKLDEAIAAHHKAIHLRPDFPEAYNNLAAVLIEKGQLHDAIQCYRRAVTLRPDYANAWSNLAIALTDAGNLDEATDACRQAVALRPDNAEDHMNLAGRLLIAGNFSQGLPEYEWRWKVRGCASSFPAVPQPQWDGSYLDGTLLLHPEQGIGDTIQFVRYVPLVRRRCKHIVFSSPPTFRRVLSGVLRDAQWITSGDPLPPFDAHCPLLSLPLAIGTTLETIPNTVPYLHADPLAIEHWRERMAPGRAILKVGLVWAGSKANSLNHNRSLPFSSLAPVLQVPGVSFYSLQKGEAANPASNPSGGIGLTDWTHELHDLADTAALIANLDLVISVDTAVAHLAGAMGKPVWTLLAFIPDWRWLMNRDDSPWYPTMRLFRQPAIGNWDSVVGRVAEELATLGNLRNAASA